VSRARHRRPDPPPSAREVIWAAAERTSGRTRGPEFVAEHREHLDAAFAALLGQLHADRPYARLEYVRSDMGGPIYRVVDDG
jgi:hypothetical protein